MGEGGGDVEMGGCHFWITLQCSSVTFTVSGGSKLSDLQSFQLAMQDSHLIFKIFIHILIQVLY